MDEILALQRELAAVQLEQTTHKLSERNCVDLIQKLKALGLIEVYFTLNAREFLTPSQLQLEIEDEVLASGGRIAVKDLQPIVNVDLPIVEKAAEEIARNDNEVHLLAGELLASWYLDRLAAEIDEIIQDQGQLTIGSLATQYNLPVEFTREFIRERAGSIIHARLKGGILYTEAFIQEQVAKVGGILAAITRPTPIPHLISMYGLEESVAEEAITLFINKGVFSGSIRNREFVPAIFAQTQRDAVATFFKSNGYFELDRAWKLDVSKPKEFLLKLFPDSVPLETCVVSSNYLVHLEGAIENCVLEKSWFCALPMLPPVATDDDVSMLLHQCKSLSTSAGGKAARASPASHLAEVYVASRAFVESLTESLAAKAPTEAKVFAEQVRKFGPRRANDSGNKAGKQTSEKASTKAGRGKKATKGGKKGKRRGGRGADDWSDEDKSDEEDLPEVSNKKGGKKGRRRRPDNPALGGDGDDARPAHSAEASLEESYAEFRPSNQRLAEAIVASHPQLEEHEALVSALVEEIRHKIDEVYDAALRTALSSVLRGDALTKKQKREEFESALDKFYKELCLFKKGIDAIKLLPAKSLPGVSSMEELLLDTHGCRLAYLITDHICYQHDIGYIDRAKSADAGQLPRFLSMEMKKLLEESLPSSVASAVVKMWTLAVAGRRHIDDFVEHIEASGEVLSYVARPLDKKTEKQLVFGYRQDLLSRLTMVVAPQSIMGCSLSLVFQKSVGAAVVLIGGESTPTSNETAAESPAETSYVNLSSPQVAYSPDVQYDIHAVVIQSISDRVKDVEGGSQMVGELLQLASALRQSDTEGRSGQGIDEQLCNAVKQIGLTKDPWTLYAAEQP